MTTTHRRREAAALAGIALLTASQLLLGYPQYVWFSLLAEGAYVLGTSRRGAEPRPRTAWWVWPLPWAW